MGSLRRSELDALGAAPFAHRGLHGGGRIENGLGAFQAAVEQGFGVELDVRLSRDGRAMVFHDETLERLTDVSGPVAERSAAELSAVRLGTGSDTIPTLEEVLAVVAGRAGMLIEVKAPDRRVGALGVAVETALGGYRGAVGIMSFNPEVGAWFARRAPRRLRGLVVSESGKRGLRGRVERRLALWRSRADFLAYDVRDLPSSFAAHARGAGRAVYTWTVRSEADRVRAAANADQIIFEMPPS